MLLNFRVSNYRSFKEEASLSTLATRLDKGYGFPSQVASDGSSIDVLPVVAILGANASGKSNLLRAMASMRDLVLNSASMPRYQDLGAEPFLLDPTYAEKPTLMEVDFILDRARFQYGFEITKGRVTEEWLYTFPHKRTQVLFDRENGGEFQFGKNLGGYNRVISEMTRPQVLFLSAAANASHPLLTKIYDFFVSNLNLLDVPARGYADKGMIRRLGERRAKAVKLLSYADLGIMDARIDLGEQSADEKESLRVSLRDALNFPPGATDEEKDVHVNELLQSFLADEPTIELLHQGRRGLTALPFEQESHGTKSWLSFVTYALEAIEKGGILLVDELDASLHPLLLAEALRMFQSPESNPNGAQLIFTTHDVTTLGGARETLDKYRLTRGQIWLVEKERDGGSALTPLSEYRPRKGEDLARGYLQGRYGGTPRLSSPLVQAELSEKSNG